MVGLPWYTAVLQFSGFAWVALWLAQLVVFLAYSRLSRWMWLLVAGAALELCGSGSSRLLVAALRPVTFNTGQATAWQTLFVLISFGSLIGGLIYLAGLFAVFSDLSKRLRGQPGLQPEPIEQPLWPDG